MGKHKQIRVKNLETGEIRLQGEGFLERQAKPYVGANGKGFPKGVWVEAGASEKKPLSDDAKAIISGQPLPPAPQGADVPGPDANQSTDNVIQ